MIDITYILTIVLFILVVYILFTKRKKHNLEGIKQLVWNANQDILEAHKSLQKTNKRLDELYKAIISIEKGELKGGNK